MEKMKFITLYNLYYTYLLIFLHVMNKKSDIRTGRIITDPNVWARMKVR